MNLRTTRTYAKLEVSKAAFEEIWKKMEQAGYEHALLLEQGDDLSHMSVIDMHGIGLVCEPTPELPPRENPAMVEPDQKVDI